MGKHAGVCSSWALNVKRELKGGERWAKGLSWDKNLMPVLSLGGHRVLP